MTTKTTIKQLIFFIAVAFALSACDKKTPLPQPEPQPPVVHVKPAAIDIKLRESHLHGAMAHGNAFSPTSKFPLPRVQEIKLRLSANGENYEMVSKDPFRMIKGDVYALEFIAYDKDGKRINADYCSAEKANLYQLFFDVKNVKDTKTGKPAQGTAKEILSGFVYRDTDPENKMFNLNDKTVKQLGNPVGFKGYFHNPEAPKGTPHGMQGVYVAFDLQASLVQFASLAEKKQGDAFRAGVPLDASLAKKVVFNFWFPVRIITQNPVTDDWTVYCADIAKEYQITPQEVKAALDADLEEDIDGESSTYYL